MATTLPSPSKATVALSCRSNSWPPVKPDAPALAPPLGAGSAARLQVDMEEKRPLEDDHRAEQLASPCRHVLAQVSARTQGQAVGDPQKAARRPQLRGEHAAVGLVALSRLEDLVRRQSEGSTTGGVQQRAKEGLVVEPRQAQPHHGAVPSDQSGGRPVSNKPEVLDGWVSAVPERCERRRGVARSRHGGGIHREPARIRTGVTAAVGPSSNRCMVSALAPATMSPSFAYRRPVGQRGAGPPLRWRSPPPAR